MFKKKDDDNYNNNVLINNKLCYTAFNRLVRFNLYLFKITLMFINSSKKLFLINKKFFNNISRNLKTNKSNKLAAISHVNPWKKVKDSNGSNSYYYWNTETNETTPLGHIYPNHLFVYIVVKLYIHISHRLF